MLIIIPWATNDGAIRMRSEGWSPLCEREEEIVTGGAERIC